MIDDDDLDDGADDRGADAGAPAELAAELGPWWAPPPGVDLGLTAHLDGFSITARLVVSCFAEVGPQLVADAHDLAHPVLDALAGNTSARWAVSESATAVAPASRYTSG